MSQNVIRKMNCNYFPITPEPYNIKVCRCDCLIKYLEKKILVTGQFGFMMGLSLETSPDEIQYLGTKRHQIPFLLVVPDLTVVVCVPPHRNPP